MTKIPLPKLHLTEARRPRGGASWVAVECSCGWRSIAEDRWHHDHDKEARIMMLEHKIDTLLGIKTPPNQNLEYRLTNPKEDYFPWPFRYHPGDREYVHQLESDQRAAEREAQLTKEKHVPDYEPGL